MEFIVFQPISLDNESRKKKQRQKYMNGDEGKWEHKEIIK